MADSQERNEDPAAILRDHFTNLSPVTQRVAERVLAELDDLRARVASSSGAPVSAPASAESGRSHFCERCVHVERLAAQLLALYRGDADAGRSDAVRAIRDLADGILRNERSTR